MHQASGRHGTMNTLNDTPVGNMKERRTPTLGYRGGADGLFHPLQALHHRLIRHDWKGVPVTVQAQSRGPHEHCTRAVALHTQPTMYTSLGDMANADNGRRLHRTHTHYIHARLWLPTSFPTARRTWARTA